MFRHGNTSEWGLLQLHVPINTHINTRMSLSPVWEASFCQKKVKIVEPYLVHTPPPLTGIGKYVPATMRTASRQDCEERKGGATVAVSADGKGPEKTTAKKSSHIYSLYAATEQKWVSLVHWWWSWWKGHLTFTTTLKMTAYDLFLVPWCA